MAEVDIRQGYKDSAWFTANPTVVLKEGQVVHLEQTGLYKIGDGSTTLANLVWQPATVSGGSSSSSQTKIQLKKDTAANWTSSNPTLLSGEQGLETDTGLTKMGTGAAWNSTDYENVVLQTTGTDLTFSRDRNYGTVASPETGNITADVTGARLGVTNVIIHNHSSEPTFDSKFKKLSGSGDYSTGEINYIMCQYINSTEIVYTISQRT